MGHTQIPIVGLTASVRRGDFQNIGLDDWIGKPVRLKELQKKLAGYFDGNNSDDDDNAVATVPAPVASTSGKTVTPAAQDLSSSSTTPSPAPSRNPLKRRRVSIEKPVSATGAR